MVVSTCIIFTHFVPNFINSQIFIPFALTFLDTDEKEHISSSNIK